jgi:hypothetical protein
MRHKGKQGYIFMGGSISSRDAQEAKQIAGRIKKLCAVLDRRGYTYDVDILTNTSVHRGAKTNLEIPKQYRKIAPSVVQSISALRVQNDPYDLKDEIACYQWSLDLLEKSAACIWDLTKSSSGSGFEIATALAMRKPCLVLFDRPTVSTMINGCTSRLLMVRRWNDQIEDTIEKFIEKVETALDRSVRFSVSQEMFEWLGRGFRMRGFESLSEYLRYLVDDDRKRLNSGDESE